MMLSCRPLELTFDEPRSQADKQALDEHVKNTAPVVTEIKDLAGALQHFAYNAAS
jgi:hypothetical protein